MSVVNIRNTFREYCDEPSTSWLTDAQAGLWLGQAYEEFRQIITDVDRSAFLAGVSLVVAAGQIDYNLGAAASAVRILGNPAGGLTHARLRRAYDVFHDDGTGRPDYYLTPAANFRQLNHFQRKTGPISGYPSWWLHETTLAFSEAPGAGTFVLVYFPEQSGTNWSGASTDVVDDYVAFHDVISLLAARSYLARDGVSNPMLEKLIAERRQSLINWVQASRNIDANDSVIDEYP